MMGRWWFMSLACLVVIGAALLGCEPQPGGDVSFDARWLDRIALTGSSESAPVGTDYDVQMDLPLALRQKNWGGGSCVHASTVNLLRWQGQYEMAEWWRKNYIGGEYANRLIQRMESAGLRYAYTDKGDVEFLRWCVKTRRGAGIFYKPNHAINLIGMDDKNAYLLDNNATAYPEQRGFYEAVPLDRFIPAWKGYGGFAWTLIYVPPPPNPRIFEEPIQ